MSKAFSYSTSTSTSLNSSSIGSPSAKLAALSAGGNDRNLKTHGRDPHYWYSISDGHRLLLDIRQRLLSSSYVPDGPETGVVVREGEEYASTRENTLGVFVADPYYYSMGSVDTEIFSNYLNSDIDRIIKQGAYFGIETRAWERLPEKLIISTLSGAHWRVVCAEIDYGERSTTEIAESGSDAAVVVLPTWTRNPTLKVTINDPYGGSNLNTTMRDEITKSLHSVANKLLNVKYTSDELLEITPDNVELIVKEADQQGRGTNGWDCAPITFKNIEDYVGQAISGNSLSDFTEFTIPSVGTEDHDAKVVAIRQEHIQEYARVTGVPINEIRDQEIAELIKQDAVAKKEQYKASTSDIDIHRKISDLSPQQITYFFTLLESKILSKSTGSATAYVPTEDDKRIALEEVKKITKASDTELDSIHLKKDSATVSEQATPKKAAQSSKSKVHKDLELLLESIKSSLGEELEAAVNELVSITDKKHHKNLHEKVMHCHFKVGWSAKQIINVMHYFTDKAKTPITLFLDILNLINNYELHYESVIAILGDNKIPHVEWEKNIMEHAVSSHFITKKPYENTKSDKLVEYIKANNAPVLRVIIDKVETQFHGVKTKLNAAEASAILGDSCSLFIKDWGKEHVMQWADVTTKDQALTFQVEVVSVIGIASKLHTGHELRDVQLLSLLLLLNADGKGMIEQIYTGEGKSTITSMFAAVRAMQGHKVDVITTSEVLAKRDAEDLGAFYKILKLTVSCNINLKDDSEKNECYKSDIVYGTPHSFTGDILHHEFSQKNIRGERKFDIAVVDEVDSLIVDRKNHVTYLSGNDSGMWRLTPILRVIWEQLNESKFRILKITSEQFNEKLVGLATKLIDAKEFLIPDYLKTYAREHITKWVDNAVRARDKYMEYKDYMIKGGVIVPVDYNNTGVLQYRTHWSNGLHQFLEMKHNLEVSDLSLMTNYQSYMEFFQRYKSNIFGVTGTVGSKGTQKFISESYNLDIVFIPTYAQRQLLNFPKQIVSGAEWSDTVVHSVIKELSYGRAVLLICKTIEQTKQFKVLFESRSYGLDHPIIVHVYNENDVNHSAHPIEQREGGVEPHEVIIATNLAGRGTNIKISDKVRQAGGLHVCIGFIPDNLRIEDQASGRAGRQGDPGTSQLIIPAEERTIAETSFFYEMRDSDWYESQLYDQKNKEVKELEIQQGLLKKFYELRDEELKKARFKSTILADKYDLVNNPYYTKEGEESSEIDRITKSALEERWGFFLSSIETFSNPHVIEEKFEAFKQRILKDFQEDKLIINPAHYNRRASVAIKQKDIKAVLDFASKSIELFNTSYVPYTYKAYAEAYRVREKEGDIAGLETVLKILEVAKFLFMKEITIYEQELHVKAKDNKATTAHNYIYSYLESSIKIVTTEIGNAKEARRLSPGAKKLLEVISPEWNPLGAEYNADLLKEIIILQSQGIDYLITIGTRPTKSQLVWFCTLGVIQIALGVALSAASGGTLAMFGTALIADGAADILQGFYSESYDIKVTAGEYGIGKVGSLLAGAGFAGFAGSSFSTLPRAGSFFPKIWQAGKFVVTHQTAKGIARMATPFVAKYIASWFREKKGIEIKDDIPIDAATQKSYAENLAAMIQDMVEEIEKIGSVVEKVIEEAALENKAMQKQVLHSVVSGVADKFVEKSAQEFNIPMSEKQTQVALDGIIHKTSVETSTFAPLTKDDIKVELDRVASKTHNDATDELKRKFSEVILPHINKLSKFTTKVADVVSVVAEELSKAKPGHKTAKLTSAVAEAAETGQAASRPKTKAEEEVESILENMLSTSPESFDDLISRVKDYEGPHKEIVQKACQPIIQQLESSVDTCNKELQSSLSAAGKAQAQNTLLSATGFVEPPPQQLSNPLCSFAIDYPYTKEDMAYVSSVLQKDIQYPIVVVENFEEMVEKAKENMYSKPILSLLKIDDKWINFIVLKEQYALGTKVKVLSTASSDIVDKDELETEYTKEGCFPHIETLFNHYVDGLINASSSSICALENIRIISRYLDENQEDFIDNFSKGNIKFCDVDQVPDLRRNEFRTMYVEARLAKLLDSIIGEAKGVDAIKMCLELFDETLENHVILRLVIDLQASSDNANFIKDICIKEKHRLEMILEQERLKIEVAEKLLQEQHAREVAEKEALTAKRATEIKDQEIEIMKQKVKEQENKIKEKLHKQIKKWHSKNKTYEEIVEDIDDSDVDIDYVRSVIEGSSPIPHSILNELDMDITHLEHVDVHITGDVPEHFN